MRTGSVRFAGSSARTGRVTRFGRQQAATASRIQTALGRTMGRDSCQRIYLARPGQEGDSAEIGGAHVTRRDMQRCTSRLKECAVKVYLSIPGAARPARKEVREFSTGPMRSLGFSPFRLDQDIQEIWEVRT